MAIKCISSLGDYINSFGGDTPEGDINIEGNLFGPVEDVKKKDDEQFYQDVLGMLNLDPNSEFQNSLKKPLRMLSSLTPEQFSRIVPSDFEFKKTLDKNDLGDLVGAAQKYNSDTLLFDAGTLPTIDVTPNGDSILAKWHSDKMFGQLSNSDRHKLLYDIIYTMDQDAGRNKNGKVGKLSDVEAINRLYKIYKESGSPKAFSTGKGDNILDALLNDGIYNPILGSDRAHYLPWNNMYNINSLWDYMAELSHAAQFYNPKYAGHKGTWYDIVPGDIPIGGKNGYERPTNREYQAHKVIEPQLWKEALGVDVTGNQHSNGGPLSSYSPSGDLKPISNITDFINRYDDGGALSAGRITIGLDAAKMMQEAAKKAKAGPVVIDNTHQAVHTSKDGNKHFTGEARQAMQFFMNKGLTEHQALGMVANLMAESGLNPKSESAKDKQGRYAYGIAQWRGDRQAKLFKKYGKNPSLRNQLDYVWEELNSTHKRGLKELMSSKTAEDAARAALGYYEFSNGVQSAIEAFNKSGQNGRKAYISKLDWVNRLRGSKLLPSNYDDEYLINNDMAKLDEGIYNTTHAVPAQYLYPFPEQKQPTYEVNQPIVPTSSLESFVDVLHANDTKVVSQEELLKPWLEQQELERQKTLKNNLFNYVMESTSTPTTKLQFTPQVNSNDLMKMYESYIRF